VPDTPAEPEDPEVSESGADTSKPSEDQPSEDQAEGEDDDEKSPGIIGRILGVGRGDDDEKDDDEDKDEASATAVQPSPPPVPAPAPSPAPSAPAADGEATDVNKATFEDLRELGFSVTQATRVITYRERQNGFDSLNDLAAVPGMPRSLMRELEGRLRVG